MAREGVADGMGDTITRVTSLCLSCATNASKGTRRSGADAVPKMSPSYLSTQTYEVFRRVLAVVSGNHIDYVVAGECDRSVKAYQAHRDKLWGAIEGHT